MIRALIDEKLRRAFGYPKPAAWFCGMIKGALWLRKHVKRVFNIEKHPKLIANTLNRTYPGNAYTIEGIAPSHMKDRP